MPRNESVQIGLLKKTEVEEAHRIMKMAFGTFLGLPEPLQFMGDRNFLAPRSRAAHVRILAAREKGKLIGTNAVTRWGSFGFFGPLTVLPEYWDRGVAQRLMEVTMSTFDEWGVRHTGLFTFAHSAKHVGLYQKFGYWPRYLTAIMTRAPKVQAEGGGDEKSAYVLLSALKKAKREEAVRACRRLTHKIDKGLDLEAEIREVLARHSGEVVLTQTRGALDGFAVCMIGAGTEGGEKTCYIKFGAARGGAGAGKRFDRLVAACEAFADSRGAAVEAGVNLAREDAYRRMRASGYRVAVQGVAMQRPHAKGFNRSGAYVIDDWR